MAKNYRDNFDYSEAIANSTSKIGRASCRERV